MSIGDVTEAISEKHLFRSTIRYTEMYRKVGRLAIIYFNNFNKLSSCPDKVVAVREELEQADRYKKCKSPNVIEIYHNHAV